MGEDRGQFDRSEIGDRRPLKTYFFLAAKNFANQNNVRNSPNPLVARIAKFRASPDTDDPSGESFERYQRQFHNGFALLALACCESYRSQIGKQGRIQDRYLALDQIFVFDEHESGFIGGVQLLVVAAYHNGNNAALVGLETQLLGVLRKCRAESDKANDRSPGRRKKQTERYYLQKWSIHMRVIAGAILIVAASILVAAGIIVDGLNKGAGGHGTPGYIFGFLLGVVGIVVFAGRRLRRAWDAIPIEDKKTKNAS